MAKRRARPGIDHVPLPFEDVQLSGENVGALGVDAVFPGDEPVRLKTLELTNQDDLNDLRALLDHAQEVLDQRDARVDMTEISINLISALQDLGDHYGAFGVARAAAGLTDADVLVRNLGFDVDGDVKDWSTPELLRMLGQIHDELDGRGVDVNDHAEYRTPGSTSEPMLRGSGSFGTTSVSAPKYDLAAGRGLQTLSPHLERIAIKAATKAITDYFSES